MKRLPFRTEMARVWHLGMKTVTRRLIKPQPESVEYWLHGEPSDHIKGMPTLREANGQGWALCGPFAPVYPVGSTVIIAEPLMKGKDRFGLYNIAFYAADGMSVHDEKEGFNRLWERSPGQPYKVSRLSGRYMPNWAARSWARVVSVRVERLQEITEEDAKLEGAMYARSLAAFTMDGKSWWMSAVEAYSVYIDDINGPGTWDTNPFVFRYELEKLNAAPVEVKP